VAELDFSITPGPLASATVAWTHRLGGAGFDPEFLWVNFDGAAPAPGARITCSGGGDALVVRNVDRLWAFCAGGILIPGWGRSAGDSLVDGMAAGDVDGDGFPEVITQTVHSKLAFWNVTGSPSPGWPRAGSPEDLRTQSPPLAVDVDGDGRCDVLGLNGSGIFAALDGSGAPLAGWPLATGSGCAGDAVAADLDRNGTLEIVAPDRFGLLYAYSLPPVSGANVRPWPMVAGDPGRTAALPSFRSSTAPAPSPGPLVRGSLKAYPNPARRRPVSFAYQLTEDAQVQFDILDSSGHQVASFSRPGLQADNLVVWDPGSLPAGLYLARLRFRGARDERVEVVPVGVLR